MGLPGSAMMERRRTFHFCEGTRSGPPTSPTCGAGFTATMPLELMPTPVSSEDPAGGPTNDAPPMTAPSGNASLSSCTSRSILSGFSLFFLPFRILTNDVLLSVVLREPDPTPVNLRVEPQRSSVLVERLALLARVALPASRHDVVPRVRTP